MFKEWGFLLTEIWILLALMALVGLLAGWLIWGGTRGDDASIALSAIKDEEIKRLRSELAQEKARVAQANLEPVPVPAVEPHVAVEPAPSDVEDRGVQVVGVKPKGLDEPRDGLPDDLKLINGVGRKMEVLCNSLGYFHFDQIAAWSPEEVAWVDDNLEGFKGRVTRDAWVEQAKALSTGGGTLFKF